MAIEWQLQLYKLFFLERLYFVVWGCLKIGILMVYCVWLCDEILRMIACFCMKRLPSNPEPFCTGKLSTFSREFRYKIAQNFNIIVKSEVIELTRTNFSGIAVIPRRTSLTAPSLVLTTHGRLHPLSTTFINHRTFYLGICERAASLNLKYGTVSNLLIYHHL